MSNVHIYTAPSLPTLHRPLTPGDLAVPSLPPADESSEQAAALSGIKASDKLAKEADVDPAVMAEVERQEWHGN